MKDLKQLVAKISVEKPSQVEVPGLVSSRGFRRKLANYAYSALGEMGYISDIDHATPKPGHILFRLRDEREESFIEFNLAVVQEEGSALTAMEPNFVGYVFGHLEQPSYALQVKRSSDTTLIRPGVPLAHASELRIDPRTGEGLLIFLSNPNSGLDQSVKYLFTTSRLWGVAPGARPASMDDNPLLNTVSSEEEIRHVSNFIVKALTGPDTTPHNFGSAIRLVAETNHRLLGLR